MSEPRNYKNLTYVNSKRFKGIRVAVMWKGEQRVRYFSFATYQGRAQSAALRCRDEFERALGKPRTERKITAQIFDQGITETWKSSNRSGTKKSRYVVATFIRNGKTTRVAASIKKHGNKARGIVEAARKKAVAGYLEEL